MAKAAQSDQLRAAFEKHHDETEDRIERPEQIFELLGKPSLSEHERDGSGGTTFINERATN